MYIRLVLDNLYELLDVSIHGQITVTVREGVAFRINVTDWQIGIKETDFVLVLVPPMIDF